MCQNIKNVYVKKSKHLLFTKNKLDTMTFKHKVSFEVTYKSHQSLHKTCLKNILMTIMWPQNWPHYVSLHQFVVFINLTNVMYMEIYVHYMFMVIWPESNVFHLVVNVFIEYSKHIHWMFSLNMWKWENISPMATEVDWHTQNNGNNLTWH